MNIEDRLERALIFKKYLDNQWKLSKFSENHFNWSIHSNRLERDIGKIKSKLKKYT